MFVPPHVLDACDERGRGDCAAPNVCCQQWKCLLCCSLLVLLGMGEGDATWQQYWLCTLVVTPTNDIKVCLSNTCCYIHISLVRICIPGSV
jgi:hypothetical protein